MKRDYLSYSALKAFAKSPNHYLQYVNREHRTTDAMKLGAVAHCLALEPEQFQHIYAIAPEADRRTKVGKEIYLQFENDNAHLEVITSELHDQACAIADAVHAHPKAMYLLRGKNMEQEIQGTINGMQFRGIADAIDEHDIIDLKTCRDASPSAFARDVANFDYYLQAAIYLRLTGQRSYFWIAVESAAPYNVAVYEPDHDALEVMDMYLDHLIKKFEAWDGKPSGYTDQVSTITLPPWHKAYQHAEYGSDDEFKNFQSTL